MYGIDFIQHGVGHGRVAQALMDSEFDVLTMRPYRHNRRTYIAQPVLNRDGSPVMQEIKNGEGKVVGYSQKYGPQDVTNSLVAAFRAQDWVQADDVVQRAARPKIKFVGDLRSKGLQYVIPNGFGKTILTYEDMGEIGDADIAMDPNKEGYNDRPGFGINHMPLPIVFKDCWFSSRALAASRNGTMPLDFTTLAQAAERCAELAEKLALGVASTYQFGGGTVYGVTNFPGRLTKSMTLPSDVDWNGTVFLDEVLDMRQQAQNNYHGGPWILYTSMNWDKYLDHDYSNAKGTETLRSRVKMISGIQDVVTLDYLPGYTALLVELNASNVREVVGMEFTTIQWNPTPFRTNFKVMGIMVPQVRADQNGKIGTVHGVAA